MASGSLWQRARFMAGLLVTVAKRALPQPAPARPAAPAGGIDPEHVIEALQSGDLAVLSALGPSFASSHDAQGNPWFFIALECGSLTVLQWFLAQGASATQADRSGRLPLETIIQRHSLADENDDHAADCPAMAASLIAAGATLRARTLQGQTLADLAKTAGLGQFRF